jgi:GT2 family glycosyltransferase
MSKKIGIGIVTHNRFDNLKRLLYSIDSFDKKSIVIINDGDKFKLAGWNNNIQHNQVNLGVGKSKNKALKHLMDIGCEYIFLIEDDIYIKNMDVFERYIEASKISGIQHFNFSQHGIMNRDSWDNLKPNPRIIIDYGNIKIPFYTHCVGAFSFYTKKCLDIAGLMDENYYNACEHVDHTYNIISKGMHPPFWFFADIENSWQYIGDELWSIQQSKISSKPDHQNIVANADKVFVAKHGHLPAQTPLATREELAQSLRTIKMSYGVNNQS